MLVIVRCVRRRLTGLQVDILYPWINYPVMLFDKTKLWFQGQCITAHKDPLLHCYIRPKIIRLNLTGPDSQLNS